MLIKDLFEIKKFQNYPVFFTDRKKIDNFEKVIGNLPKDTIIIIREYDLNSKSREDFASEISSLARKRNLKFLIGKDIQLAKKLKSDGVHFSSDDKIPRAFLKKESFPLNFIFSLSCHDYKTVIRMEKTMKPDLIFISPIFPTTSHKDTKSLGLRILLKLAFKTKKHNYVAKIYALGGINSRNLRSVRKTRISGFGAIDFFNQNKNYENYTSNPIRWIRNKVMACFS